MGAKGAVGHFCSPKKPCLSATCAYSHCSHFLWMHLVYREGSKVRARLTSDRCRWGLGCRELQATTHTSTLAFHSWMGQQWEQQQQPPWWQGDKWPQARQALAVAETCKQQWPGGHRTTKGFIAQLLVPLPLPATSTRVSGPWILRQAMPIVSHAPNFLDQSWKEAKTSCIFLWMNKLTT